MNKCKECGSYAINVGRCGRDDSDPDLCDVCYWRVRYERSQAIVAKLLQGIDVAVQKLLCVELERSIREVPEIVKACDRQALQILQEAAEEARRP